MEPIVDTAALEAAEAEIARLNEELKQLEGQLADKDKVIEQMAAKMQTDMMKSMDMMQKST